MELLAIPLGCQNKAAAKWLVMRRCAVLDILMYCKHIAVSVLRTPCIHPSSRNFLAASWKNGRGGSVIFSSSPL